MDSEKKYFKRLSKFATLPTRQSLGAVGYDLYSAQVVSIPPKGRATVCTDITVSPPDGYYAQIYGRSSLAAFDGITIGGGTIDPDFKDAGVVVILFNHSTEQYKIKIGSKIAQLVFHSYFVSPDSKPVCKSRRGARGLGAMENAS